MEKKHCTVCDSIEQVRDYRLFNPNTHELTESVMICELCKQYFTGLIESIAGNGGKEK